MASSALTSRLAGALALALAACSSPPGGIDAAIVDDAAVVFDAADPGIADAALPDAGACAALPDGASCDDGDACTQVDRCTAGACVGTTPILCEAQQTCRQPGTCEPATGDCGIVNVDDGTACDDTSICTDTDTCLAGVCIGGAVIDPPGDPCDDGICFTDVTAAAEITWAASPSGTRRIGAGAAWFDADGDGWVDLLLASEGGSPTLFRNDADGTFTDVTAGSGIPILTADDLLSAAAAADYDNDGDTDLYLYYDGPNQLFANNGDGTFVDVTDTAGVAGLPMWTTAAAFGDYDNDGHLDLYVGNYIQEKMFPDHTPYPNVLYRNNGDGTFTDVTVATGTAGAGTTLAAVWSDWDRDGDADLWVCNDFGSTIEPNRLYDNDGSGGFTEIGASVNADLEIYCMGIAVGDYDRDDDLDYYFTNLGRNVLLRNDGASFSDVTTAAGVELATDACFTDLFATSWGTAFHDLDSDGWLDLYVSNGHIPAAVEIDNPEKITNRLFRNRGDGSFADISHTAAIDEDSVGRGVAFADYDQDGDIDFVQVNVDGAILYRNDSPAPGGYILLEPEGRLSNRDGLGLRVTAGTQLREVASQHGYQASSQRAVHLGLGTATESSTIQFEWPSGVVHQWLYVPTGTRARVVEPEATITSVTAFSAFDPVPVGAPVQVGVMMANYTSSALTVEVTATLRVPGLTPVSGAPDSAGVLPSSTSSAWVSVTVPAGVTAPTVAEVVATVTDAAGTRFERSASIIVGP